MMEKHNLYECGNMIKSLGAVFETLGEDSNRYFSDAAMFGLKTIADDIAERLWEIGETEEEKAMAEKGGDS